MEQEDLASPEVLSMLSQALSNLVLGDNEIRTSAERLLTEKWLPEQPEQVILALAQLVKTATDENMRSFAAVLLRRLAFRPVPSDHPDGNRSGPRTIYDHLSEDTRFRTERQLLRCLREESVENVRKKVVDTITDLALGSMERGRPWGELATVAFECTQSSVLGHRESAFRIMASVPNVLLDQDTQTVHRLLEGGLKDPQSIEVKLAALRAACAYLTNADPHTKAQAVGLMHPMLESLVPLKPSDLGQFLRTLTPFATSQPILFRQHLTPLLRFLVPMILASANPATAVAGGMSEATPTVANPYSSNQNSSNSAFPATPTASNPHGRAHSRPPSVDLPQRFLFPPPSGSAGAALQAANGRAGPSSSPLENTPAHLSQEDEDRDTMRRASLELLISISEARPSMARNCDGWVAGVVRCCLEGMSEIKDERDSTQRWLETEDPTEDDDDFGYPHVFEESLDRLACAVGGKSLLPVAFMYIPALLASHDWMQRHAGLMAIAAIAEGTSQHMETELGKIVHLVTPKFADTHPRVRYAASQCVGQLCTDLEEVVQSQYHREIFEALIPTLRAAEPRVHAHAAAAIINFCNGVDGETLRPYLDSIVDGLVHMLASSHRYVQEQAVTTLAFVADASADGFRKFYPGIMPSLLNVLRSASDPEMRPIRCKVMECAGLIAIAVGGEIFKPDADTLCTILLDIQSNINPNLDDVSLQYVMSTWAKVCQAMGPAFTQYLDRCMPPILHAAATKADVSVIDESGHRQERDGWEVVEMQGQRIEIRTASLEEKCTAFDTLHIMCSAMERSFVPYITQSLELALPALKFFFHDGVREGAAMLIPALVKNAKGAELVNSDFAHALYTPIIDGVSSEMDAGFLSSLLKCFSDILTELGRGSTLSSEDEAKFVRAVEHQLQELGQKRQARAQRIHSQEFLEEREDLLLVEEMESFALDEMQRALELLDSSHRLLVAVGSIRDLQLPQNGSTHGDD